MEIMCIKQIIGVLIMTNKKNHGKNLSILTLIVVTLSNLLLCGCPSESDDLKPGVQIGFSLGNETTIANYFRKIVITDGESDVESFPNVYSSGSTVYVYDDSAIATITGGRATPKYFNPPLALRQWKIGDRITVVLVPKDGTNEHSYGYWDSTYNSKYLSIKQDSAYTQGRNSMQKRIRVWPEEGGSSEDFALNYKEGFVASFTVTANKVIIDLNFARPETIEGENIRLKNSNGYVYIDKSNIPNSLFGSYIYLRKVNSSDNFTIYRLPFNKISFCECNKELKLNMAPRLGYKFADEAKLFLDAGRTNQANKITTGENASSSTQLNVTFTTPSTSGSMLCPTLSVSAQTEIPDFFIGKTFTGTDDQTSTGSGSVSLVMNNNKTFTLTWGGHTFVGNYVMEYDYEEEYASQFYRKVAAHLTSTTEIEKDGSWIKPNWTLNYQDPNRPNSSADIQGYSIANSSYYYRWPETSNGGGIRVHLVDPDDPEATNP